ncbi:uncharacterized protein LOC130895263 [Diorhabda carinulata]|uniref:uncharacterized protein LOC130895263 n=1 Tax=Diorhabda carinulata TaxID=1163345 RepID=UPI0025A128D1|nr:uncharacterized protein LOC130895263 [Diorhabda carinulata]
MPTTLTKKAEMQSWLSERNISFNKTMLKSELYAVIKNYKPKHKRYEIDQLFLAANHNLVRLPQYHPDLNHIKSVRAELKDYATLRRFFHRIFFRAVEISQKSEEMDIIVDNLVSDSNDEDSDTDSEQEDEDCNLSGIGIIIYRQ